MSSLRRIVAVFAKELVQMRRDRLTFAMMLGIPVLQLVLFGYAINSDPKRLPTALHLGETSPLVRSILAGLENSEYYEIVEQVGDPARLQAMLERGDATFAITVPAGFTAELVRGRRPQLLLEADASDPAATSNAVSRLEAIVQNALAPDLRRVPGPSVAPSPVDVVVHALYNPEGITQYNVVPGLLGVILTMTSVMMTGIAMTREQERGTMENLLAMPVAPFEVMIGKIAPYVGVGAVQTVIVLVAARFLFGVPFAGSLTLLLAGVMLFLVANLSLGFTFSTFARSQLQAMQLTFFFFLPSLLLSGFMFPFRGMPGWAQVLGEVFPLTHFLRVVRGIMLKGAGLPSVDHELWAIALFTLAVGGVAMLRYRRTLD